MSEPFQPVRVAFRVDDAYLLEAMRNDPTRKPGKSLARSIRNMAVAVLVMALFSFMQWKRHEDLWWLPVPIVVVLLIVFSCLTSPKGRLKATRKAICRALGEYPVEQKIEFGPDGFTVIGVNGTTSFQPWQSVARVVELPEGLAMRLPGGRFEWVSNQCFPDAGSYRRVIDVIALKVADFERAT